jgi:hypothetical protein
VAKSLRQLERRRTAVRLYNEIFIKNLCAFVPLCKTFLTENQNHTVNTLLCASTIKFINLRAFAPLWQNLSY